MKKLENAPAIKTEMFIYRYDISDDKQREEYKALCESLKAQGKQCFNVIADSKPNDRTRMRSGTIYIETDCLFSNQWNTSSDSPVNPDCRVFDWYEGIYPNKDIKEGHYTVITDEFRQLLDNVYKCGYCGSYHWAQKGLVFCDQCLGSEYLSEDLLHLLRLRPVSMDNKDRAKLSEAEKGYLLPLYVKAQTEGANTRAGQRLAKQRKDVISNAEKTIDNATIEREGFLWLLDHNINIDNCIYYNHTGKFSFGWRQPVSDSVRDKLLDVISEFPFPYEIKCSDDGKTLED